MDITQIIDKRLSDLGLSHARLAEMIEETPQAIVHWKHRGSIPVNKVKNVADALRMRAEDLIPGGGGIREDAPPDGGVDEITERLLSAWRQLPNEMRMHYLALMEYTPGPSKQVINNLPARGRGKKKTA